MINIEGREKGKPVSKGLVKSLQKVDYSFAICNKLFNMRIMYDVAMVDDEFSQFCHDCTHPESPFKYNHPHR